jgi:hypothetical protein
VARDARHLRAPGHHRRQALDDIEHPERHDECVADPQADDHERVDGADEQPDRQHRRDHQPGQVGMVAVEHRAGDRAQADRGAERDVERADHHDDEAAERQQRHRARLDQDVREVRARQEVRARYAEHGPDAGQHHQWARGQEAQREAERDAAPGRARASFALLRRGCGDVCRHRILSSSGNVSKRP